MTPEKTCEQLPDEYAGKSMDDIPELREHVELVSRDPRLWIKRFRCRKCGTIWEESYESKGHANVPAVRKVRG